MAQNQGVKVLFWPATFLCGRSRGELVSRRNSWCGAFSGLVRQPVCCKWCIGDCNFGIARIRASGKRHLKAAQRDANRHRFRYAGRQNQRLAKDMQK
jgi:hypothetical protein